MSPELVSLHICQLSRAIERSKTNKYSDKRKQDYHTQLSKLVEEICKLDLNLLKTNEQKALKFVLDFCFHSIEFLDNSTLVNIPHETVFCLENALNEWHGSDEYIIVTSLQNNLNSFSFNPTLALNQNYYDIISIWFGIDFKHRMIQINLPKYLSQDYLANVVLYHELGHFIDFKYKIISRLASSKGLSEKEANHYQEFFSDIFAAQFVGKGSNYYLNYIAHGKGDSASHPATSRRIEIVKDFLNGVKDNDILNEIKEATKDSTKKKLTVVENTLSDVDFKNFIPAEIASNNELHMLFETGWNLWINDIKEFEDKGISKSNKYTIINNLIEKSISNFKVTEEWGKCI